MIGDTVPDLVNQVVENPDIFYPDLNVEDWQEPYRVPGTAPKTLERQLLLAMGNCNAALADWKAALIKTAVDAGQTPPAVIPDDLETDYEEAVYARAMALLIPLLPGIVTDERAREQIVELGQTPATFYARSDVYLRAVRGERRGTGRLKAEVV